MTYHAEIIAVGTELLLGNIANTDAQELSQALASVGVDVLYHTVVGDNPQRLEEAVAIARKRADLLIFTGGLGPTYDDLTKETVCRVLDVPLTFHPEAAADIRRNFDTIFHREMPPGTLRQAELPEGCEVFCNRVGTAPGCVFRAGDVTAVLLPGVPSECRYLTETALLPWLRRQSSETILSHDLRIFGLSEPQVQELLGDLMDQAVNPSLAPYAKTGEVMLRLTAKGDSPGACEERMAPLLEPRCVDGWAPTSMASTSPVWRRRCCTCCTGTARPSRRQRAAPAASSQNASPICPGASCVFRGGVVSYTNEVKASVLGVPQETLDRYGAVSEPVARAMAEGVRRITGSDLSVATTGLAGPDGDDRGNPVGTVFVALSTPERTVVRHMNCGSGRDRVRMLASHCAFDLLRRELEHLPIEGE